MQHNSRSKNFGKGAVAEYYKDMRRADPQAFRVERSKLKNKEKAKHHALKYMLGKTDAEWDGSASKRAIIGKDGNVKKNINQ